MTKHLEGLFDVLESPELPFNAGASVHSGHGNKKVMMPLVLVVLGPS
jgi:hypothetical protein